MKINTLGIYPPAETGLTCNSWYGKFHLEMHLWHHLGLIYAGAGRFVLPSMDYYFSIFSSALLRAKAQGYKGARFPKMTDPDGLDSPSSIGCLLVWQAPHFILMTYALKEMGISVSKYLLLVKEIANFIASFLVKVGEDYVLDKPLIPAQECYLPDEVESPLFETEYLAKGLSLASNLLNEHHSLWDDIILHRVKPRVCNGIYMPDQTNMDHYGKKAIDHPMVLGCYSFFTSDLIDPAIMNNTLKKVLSSFDLNSMWGWDFPMMAMTAYHLGDSKLANQLLLMDCPKNQYLKNGHNPQGDRLDLPLYLPGNGGLILAIQMMERNIKL